MKILPMLVAGGVAGVVPILIADRSLPTALAQAVPAAATSDDPPKKDKASKRGTPTGKVEGGEGGEEFRDRAEGRLARITVHAGDIVDAIRCSWDDDGDKAEGTNHGGDGGDETVISLEPGETLVQVSGVLTEGDLVVVGSLSFKTTKRTVGPLGGATDGKKFILDAPKDQEICGFQGRNGAYLDAIGLVCRPLP